MDLDTLSFHEVERRDDVAYLTMDRPAAQHSLTVEMAGELRDVTEWVSQHESCRAIVLTGSEGTFCTGADLRPLEGDESDERRLWAIARRLHAAIENLIQASKPVITAVDGVAAGGGFGLALSGDLVYLSSDARLEFAYPRIGLSGDGGSSYLLPRLVGLRRAREIALLDEPIEAKQAIEMGLATDVVPTTDLESRVDEVASQLASGPTRAYGRFKQLTWDGLDRTLDDQLRAEVETLSALARSDDYANGYTAFTSGDEPTFTGE